VKVIGGGVMATFHTAAQALTFCMEIQNVLLGAPWPEGILETPYPKGLRDKGGKVFFRGFIVWMLIHWAAPIASMSNGTQLVDYLDPMVHRAARSI
jgi:hypothetical protein